MNKITIAIIVVAVVAVAGVVAWQKFYQPLKSEPVACSMEAKLCSDGSYVSRTGPNCEFTPCPNSGESYKDATYIIEGREITLVNGLSEIPIAPGSASQLITRYFGNEARGDINGDSQEDVAFLLMQDSGGSGTFYYVVAALKTADGYQGTNAVFLGDRIAPQPTEIRNGEIIVNYAERKPGESFSTPPSLGVSKYLIFKNGQLEEKPGP